MLLQNLSIVHKSVQISDHLKIFFFQQLQSANHNSWMIESQIMVIYFECDWFQMRNLLGKVMPCPSTGPKIFWVGPHFLCRTKNLITYCSSHKQFLLEKKYYLLSVKLFFVSAQKFLSFWRGTNALSFYRSQKFLCQSKFFEPAQKFDCI